jgi:hypothetical protein
MNFTAFPKVPRLSREVVVTEKIDGTNASVFIAGTIVEYVATVTPENPAKDVARVRNGTNRLDDFVVLAGSRNRWLTPEDDNFGFAKWVRDHAEELALLGPGHHFGEWWGVGIQRGYGLSERRFSLFNAGRWADLHTAASKLDLPAGLEWAPSCCHVVPVLYQGPFLLQNVDACLYDLRTRGSKAAPGFADPEGVVIYHTAGNHLYKKTIKGDELGKHEEAHVKKERPVRQPKDKSKGGRRVADVPVTLDRRRG